MVILQIFNFRTPAWIQFCPDMLLENRKKEDSSQCNRVPMKLPSNHWRGKLWQDLQHYIHASHMVYTKPYIWLLVLIWSDLSNKHLDMLKSFKHFKWITKDETRLSFPWQIVMADQRLWLLLKRSFSACYRLL